MPTAAVRIKFYAMPGESRRSDSGRVTVPNRPDEALCRASPTWRRLQQIATVGLGESLQRIATEGLVTVAMTARMRLTVRPDDVERQAGGNAQRNAGLKKSQAAQLRTSKW